MSRIRGNRSGFSFIELLVAMTIIGILANIAIPTAWEVRRRARGAALIGDHGAIRTAVLDYYAANNDLPQSGSMGSVPPDLVASLPNGFTFSPDRRTILVVPIPDSNSSSWAGRWLVSS